MEIRGQYISNVWFCDAKNRDRDWMGTLERLDDGSWHFEYRFRYYDPETPEPFASKDRKSWSSFTIKGTTPEEEVLRVVNELTTVIQAELGGELHSLPVRTSDTEQVILLLSTQAWCHMKKLTPEEFEAEHGKR